MGGDEQCFLLSEGSSGDLFDVMFKEEVAVKHDSEVADVWGGRQSGVVDGEAENVTGICEGFGTNEKSHFGQ